MEQEQPQPEMQEDPILETSEVESEDSQIDETTEESEEATVKPRGKYNWLTWLFVAILGLIIVGSASGWLGYQAGIDIRQENENAQRSGAVNQQFKLALEDIENKQYSIAQQRLEYVINLDPAFPGAAEKLAEVLIVLHTTATPTITPSPTPVPATPTPDLRSELEMFSHAEILVKNYEWDAAIETLETLRKKNPNFNAIQVDGFLYTSLRNRGVDKIRQGRLELGIYDLTLAQGFGLLDTEASAWRIWARYYLAGASFWEVDWGQAVFYFSQVAPLAPNLHDGSYWTAATRYLEAVINYAEFLEEIPDWCGAEHYFRLAVDLGSDMPLQEAIEITAKRCSIALGTPEATVTPTITLTPEVTLTPVITETLVVPTETPASYPGP